MDSALQTSRSDRRRPITRSLLGRVAAVAVVAMVPAVLAASPASAGHDSWSTNKYVNLSSTVASDLCGYLYHRGTIDYPLIGNTTVVGVGQINTYRCSTDRGRSIDLTQQQNSITWSGVAVTGCSVGAGGGSCSGGLTSKTWTSPKLGGSASSYTQNFTVYGGNFALKVTHRTSGYWKNNSNDDSNSISSSRWL